MIGGTDAEVTFAGLVAPGLYQINVKVPESATDGDLPIQLYIQGGQTSGNLIVAVQQ
jgi:uncharacterized protein (TIGR03437 family)